MTTLLAVAGFALLFALAGVIPLRGEGGGCGGCTHHGSGSCAEGRCELDAVDRLLREVETSAREGWRDDR